MKKLELKFLAKVLGNNGVNAVVAASVIYPEIKDIILPRTMIAWVNNAIEKKYTGSVPELSDVHIDTSADSHIKLAIKGEEMTVSRVEAIARLTQMVSGNSDYVFTQKPKMVSDLGKTIDLLVKSSFL